MSEFWHAIKSSDFVCHLGWMLIHSFWVGMVMAILLAVGGRFLRRRSANARYLIGCGILAGMVVISGMTYFLVPANTQFKSAQGLERRIGRLDIASQTQISHVKISQPGAMAPAPISLGTILSDPRHTASNTLAPESPDSPAISQIKRTLLTIEPFLPWLAAFLIVGVASLAFYLQIRCDPHGDKQAGKVPGPA